MNWELFYLVCFVVGFSFTVLSFLSGTLHFHFHLPGHVHVPASLGHAGHGAGHGGAHGPGHGSGAHFPFFNPMTAAAFLTWFGGAGYLLVHLRHLWIVVAIAIATLAGLAGASLVFLFVAKVLMANDRDLDPLDYEMVGVLGRISVPIRTEGTGEIIFDQEGVRKTCAARCEHEESLSKGEEIVVTRYERGVAYVRRWEELANPAGVLPVGKTTI